MPLHGDYAPSPSARAAQQVAGYEASGGTKHNTMGGQPVIILTTVGRHSGKLRKTPLMRVEHDGRYVAVASQGGAPKHPVWYLNLLAEPRVELQDGPEPVEMRARVLEGAERAEWWARANEVWPAYDGYQAKTEREIPVVLLEPL